MFRTLLIVASVAVLALPTQGVAQTAAEQKPLTCQVDGTEMESALMRRIAGGLGVTIGDYQNCVSFCKANFPADSNALIECIKGCRDIKAAPSAVILR